MLIAVLVLVSMLSGIMLSVIMLIVLAPITNNPSTLIIQSKSQMLKMIAQMLRGRHSFISDYNFLII